MISRLTRHGLPPCRDSAGAAHHLFPNLFSQAAFLNALRFRRAACAAAWPIFSSSCPSPRPPSMAGRLLLILPLGPHDGPDGRGREDNRGENPCPRSTLCQHFYTSAISNCGACSNRARYDLDCSIAGLDRAPRCAAQSGEHQARSRASADAPPAAGVLNPDGLPALPKGSAGFARGCREESLHPVASRLVA